MKKNLEGFKMGAKKQSFCYAKKKTCDQNLKNTIFPKEFFNEIWLKVDCEYNYIAGIKF